MDWMKPFKIWKLRSMRIDVNIKELSVIKIRPRNTKVGLFSELHV